MIGALLVLAAIVGGYIWIDQRKQARMTREFLQLMNERYHS
jgi:hypothetical protein